MSSLLLLGLTRALAADPGTGIDAHGFELAAQTGDPRGALGVESPLRFEPWSAWAALVFEYADRPLVEHTRPDGGERIAWLDELYALNGSTGLALGDRVRLDVAMPLYLSSLGAGGELQGVGVGDLRVAPMVALLRGPDADRGGLGLAVQPFVIAPTGSSTDYLGVPGWSGGGSVLAAWVSPRWTVGGLLGARFGPEVEVMNLSGADRVDLGAHVGWLATPAVGLHLEASAAPPLVRNEEPGTDTPAELRLAARTRTAGGGQLVVGGATALSRGASAAAFRVFVGGGIGPAGGPRGPSDRDLDGLSDDVDRCPDQPETRNGRDDGDGCPDTLSALLVSALRDGRPVEGAALDLTGPAGTSPVRGLSGPEPWSVPTEAGQAWSARATLGACLAGLADTTTTAEPLPLPVPLVPVRDAHVTVEVEDPDGKPLPTATVRWSSPDPACVDTAPARGGERVAVGPGTHTAMVYADGYRPATLAEPLASGDDKRLEVRLEPSKANIVGSRILILTPVYFDHDRDTIRADSYPVLQDVAAVLLAHPEFTLVAVDGHTDSDGSEDYNLDLSQRRVDSVRRFLVERGVEAGRLQARGFGERFPVSTNRTADGKAANRRVEFNIVTRTDGGLVNVDPAR